MKDSIAAGLRPAAIFRIFYTFYKKYTKACHCVVIQLYYKECKSNTKEMFGNEKSYYLRNL